MSSALRRSLRVHGQMLRTAWTDQADAPRQPGRLLRLGALAAPYAAAQAVHWVGFALDELTHSDYRSVAVDAPLFVVGIPRSGTTFVHRTLAADPGFTSLTAWEALLAPSVTERRVAQALAAVDQSLGAPTLRGLNHMLARLSAQLDDIHPIAPEDAEEDYLALLPMAGCFLPALGFPGAESLWALADLDEAVSPTSQAVLLAAYHGLLQRHLYAHRSDTGHAPRLLSKNAAFSTWTPALAQRYPDARFIVCMRDPVEALSSQLSSIAAARELFGTDPEGRTFPDRFRHIYAASLRSLRRAIDGSPQRFAVVQMEALKQRPGETLHDALTTLNERVSPELGHALARADRQAGGFQSAHRHRIEQFGLCSQTLRRELEPDYHAICAHRIDTLQEAS